MDEWTGQTVRVAAVALARAQAGFTHLMDVTSHPRDTAALHTLDPRKPLPPQTTSLLAVDIFVTGGGFLLLTQASQLRAGYNPAVDVVGLKKKRRY